MAGVETIEDAKALHAKYVARAEAEFNPQLTHSKMGIAARREALQKLRSDQASIIVCVNMLGEGFRQLDPFTLGPGGKRAPRAAGRHAGISHGHLSHSDVRLVQRVVTERQGSYSVQRLRADSPLPGPGSTLIPRLDGSRT